MVEGRLRRQTLVKFWRCTGWLWRDQRLQLKPGYGDKDLMLRGARWHVGRLCLRIGQAGRCLVRGRRRRKDSPAIIFKCAPPPENNFSHRHRRISTTIRLATFNAAFFALSSAQFYPSSPVSALTPKREPNSSAFFELSSAQLRLRPLPPASTEKGKSPQREEKAICSAPLSKTSSMQCHHAPNSAFRDKGKLPLPTTPPHGSRSAFVELSAAELRRPPRFASIDKAKWVQVGGSASFPPLSSQARLRNSTFRSTSFSSATSYGASPRSILNVLREADADLVALQQVKSDEADGMRPLSALARALGMHYAFAESWAPEFGNAVLSRWPIKSVHVSKLADESDWRNVLKVVVEVPYAGELQFCCTHLDHLDEDWRLKQAVALTNSCKDVPHILAGDFNALDPSDYSGARWKDIAQLRARIGKNPPRHDVMRFLKQQLGYRDAKAHIAADIDSVVVLPPGQGTPGTCKYGTRVDYILASPDLPYRFVPGSYAMVSSKGTSDHHLVKVEIEPATLK